MAEEQEATREGGASPPEPEQGGAVGKIPAPASPAADWRRPNLLLAVVLGLVLVGIVLSPFWAPEIASLLPWGEKPSPISDYSALAARLEAIERRPVAPAIDVDAIKSVENALGRRVDQLESASSVDRQTEASIAATKTALQQLEQRLGANEAQSTSRAAAEAAATQKVQQELARLGTAAADLTDRLQALERQLRTQIGGERTDAALLLALLQLREAIDQGRPFGAEFAAFAALAHDRPDLAAAAGPLAGAAPDGVPGRSALVKSLAELAGRITTVEAVPPAADWRTQALSRLRSLVTIRRIDGAPQGEPEAAVSTAERALGRGDLGDAVNALDRLSGANAEAAADWLSLARRRLSVEAALAHLQELLAAGLGRPVDAPAPSRTPS
jgi:hypothetical protein